MSYNKYQLTRDSIYELDELISFDFEALANLDKKEKLAMQKIAEMMFEFAETYTRDEFNDRLNEAEAELEND